MEKGNTVDEYPWNPVHTKLESLDAESGAERRGKETPLSQIIERAFELSHLVQSGRRVSRGELQAVDHEVHGPKGYLGS